MYLITYQHVLKILPSGPQMLTFSTVSLFGFHCSQLLRTFSSITSNVYTCRLCIKILKQHNGTCTFDFANSLKVHLSNYIQESEKSVPFVFGAVAFLHCQLDLQTLVKIAVFSEIHRFPWRSPKCIYIFLHHLCILCFLRQKNCYS